MFFFVFIMIKSQKNKDYKLKEVIEKVYFRHR